METDNACGWCLYGGLCSGNSDSCPVPAGVNDSYIMVTLLRIFQLYNCHTYLYPRINALPLTFPSLAAVLDFLRCVQL